MSKSYKLNKAKDLYLRGFDSKSIKCRTGISHQKLLHELRKQGVILNSDSKIEYTVSYISSRYAIDAIKKGLLDYLKATDKPHLLTKKNKMKLFGCQFGNYKAVFSMLLGEEVYHEIANEARLFKRSQTMIEKYGTDITGNIEEFATKRVNTLKNRYGVTSPNAHPLFASKMQTSLVKTMNERYGVDYPTQVPIIAKKVHDNRQKTMLKLYGAKNTVQVEELRDKIFEARRKNKTLNTSRPEAVLGDLLIALFGKDDVVHNKVIDSRYPFHVDYYIKSRDLFIELNGDRSHGFHWFDKDNKQDIQTLNAFIENQQRIESETKKRSRYRNYIKVWTKTDVKKREMAAKNQLNYLVFWDGSCKTRHKFQYPRLKDVYEWINAGCPNSDSWRKENTY